MKRPFVNLVPIAWALAALGTIGIASRPAADRFWPRTLPPGERAHLATTRARVAALRDAHADRSAASARFDPLLGLVRAGLGTDTPTDLSDELARLAAARDQERRDGAPNAEVDATLTRMEVELDRLDRAQQPPDWLASVEGAGLGATLLSFSLFGIALRRHADERREIAAVLKIDQGLLGRASLPAAVKEVIYAERLKAVRPKDPPPVVRRETERDNQPILRSQTPSPTPPASVVPRSDALPVLAIPELRFDRAPVETTPAAHAPQPSEP
jgi:hypothetical protein